MSDAAHLAEAVRLAYDCPPSATAFSVGADIAAPCGPVLARGHSRQEQPADHAEEVALRHAPPDLAGATMYTSLEPCGQRASRPDTCAELIIAAGIRRVVYAWDEPSLFVPARGAEVLRAAGIEVVKLDVYEEPARAANAHLLDSRPKEPEHMPNPLITAAQLSQALSEEPPPVLLDVRWSLGGPPGRDAYELGHIPGAVFLDIDDDVCGPPGPEGRHPLPDPARLQDVLRAAGVNTATTVVCYDAGDNLAASRLWWTLRWAGHSDVLVLDGGMAAWLAADGALSTATPEPPRGDIEVRPGGMPVLDAEAAARLAGEGLLIDVRAPERFRGETEPIDPVAGHIPGAVNVPDAPNLAETGGFRSPSELAARYAPLGAEDPDLAIGTYCGSGITATHTALAMTAAGLPTPAVYIGSWSNWVADSGRPVATGEE